MKYSDLSNLLLKISGLLIVIYTIINIPNYFIGYYSAQNFFGNQASDLVAFIISVVVPVIVSITIGFLLFKFPKTITNKLVSGTSEASDINLNSITTVVYSIIGMYFVAFSLADLFYWGAYYGVMENAVKSSEFFSAENKVRVIVTFIELCIGLVLLLGSSGINKLILKARTAGVR